MLRVLQFAVVAVAAMTMVGCTPEAHQAPPRSTGGTAAPLTPAGASASVQADADENLQWAASVVQIDILAHQGDVGVKLFGTAGGDPAMNGLYTHVAFFESPAEGWRVFRLGDFLEYRVLSDAPGHVDLEIKESTMNDKTGEIGNQTRRIIVTWSVGTDTAIPASITVTPAR